tara:strand:- start:4270 stop:4824 length:555 start_codon:yes stop_codon:yes gene_type:complete
MNPLNKEIPHFKYFRTRFWLYIFNCTPNHKSFDGLRKNLLILVGFQIKGNVKVFSPVEISPKTNPKNIYLEGFVFINSGARFSVPEGGKIEICTDTLVGPNAHFETVNHGMFYKEGKSRGATIGKIKIGRGVWIGANVLILQNVNIDKGAVVAAASVVNKSIESYNLVGGIPARILKKLDEGNK